MNNFIKHTFCTTLTPLFGVFVVFMQTSLHAQHADTLTNQIQQMNEIVVTGQYAEGSYKRSAYKVRVIDSKRMELQGAFTLRDVLTNELNVRISQDPALGSSMSLQGVSGQNIKVLIDGVPVIGRENGNIDLTQINLANIERIEMVEGPMNVNFGTNALGGVVNLITKKFNQQLKAGANAYYETVGQYNAGAHFNGSYRNVSMGFNGGRNFFQGFHPDKDSRLKWWKPREQYFADLSTALRMKSGSVRLTGQFFNEKVTSRDSGVITPYYAYGLDQYFYTRRLTGSFFIDHKLSGNKEISVLGSYSGYRRISNTVRKDLVSLEEKLVPDEGQQDTNYFTQLMSRGTFSKAKKGSRFNYQLGYEVNVETAEGPRILNEKQGMSDYNAFTSAEIRMRRLLVRPGVRYTYNTRFEAPLIPSLHVKYDITDRLTARASYGRGFRAPSLKELFLHFSDPAHNVQGNPNLVAETGDNVQASLQWEFSNPGGIVRVGPSGFYNHITHMIDLVRLGSNTLEARYMNVSEFKSAGANMNAEYRSQHYSFAAGYSYTGQYSALVKANPDNHFFFSHEVRANASYTFSKPDLTIAAFYKYNGRVQNYIYEITTDRIVMGYINDFSLLDVTASKNFFHRSLSVSMGLKNILDVQNVSAITGGIHTTGNNAQAAMGRTFFVGMRYSFEKTRS